MLHRVYELLLGAFELSQKNLSVSHSDAWLFGVALECFGESMHAFGQKKEPRGLFSINNVAEAVSLGLYVFTCLFSSKLSLFSYINQ